VLGPSQEKIADKAQILLDALADVAIIALIDEATGYQKRRAHNELQRILSAYIAPELLPWQRRFPISYYEQLHRVMGWRFYASSTARSAYIGKLTNRLIYDKLPPGVLQELRRRNPTDPVTKLRHYPRVARDPHPVSRSFRPGFAERSPVALPPHPPANSPGQEPS
jgi:hypothetical protein